MNDNPTLAWMPALFVLTGLAPATWLISTTLGYIISAGFLLLLTAYVFFDQQTGVESIHTIVITLLILYWIGLIVQFGITTTMGYLPYIFLIPIVIVACMIVAPRLVHTNPLQYAAVLVSITVALTVIGLILLHLDLTTNMSFRFTGRRVLGDYPYRIASIADNSNRYGAIASLGFITAIYLRIETSQRRWTIATTFLLVGVILSNNRTALVASVIGALVLLVGQSRYSVTTLITGSVGIALAALALPAQYYEAADASLQARFDSWKLVIAEITSSPFVGAGFETILTVHNAYLGILLNAGLVAGLIYLLALTIAFGHALVKALWGSVWDIYVFAMLVTIGIRLTTSSFTIGGLTEMSLFLALYVSLAAYPPQEFRYSLPERQEYQRYDQSPRYHRSRSD